MANAAVKSISEYIAAFPPETRKVLKELRTVIRAAAPRATQTICDGIPTYELGGQYLVYFAAWKKHIGFHPITAGVAKTLGKELKPYKSGKETARFPLGEPLPKELIRKIVECRVSEVEGREGAGGKVSGTRK